MKLIQAYAKIPQFYSKALERLREIPENHPHFENGSMIMINIFSKQKNYEKGI